MAISFRVDKQLEQEFNNLISSLNMNRSDVLRDALSTKIKELEKMNKIMNKKCMCSACQSDEDKNFCNEVNELEGEKEYTKSALPAMNPWEMFGMGMEHVKITPEIAEKLNDLCNGNDASIWLRLQDEYYLQQKDEKKVG